MPGPTEPAPFLRGRGRTFAFYVCELVSILLYIVAYSEALVAQMVKNPPAMWETWVRSLGWEDSLEEGMATHSSILAWKIFMDRGAGWATVHGVAKSRTQLIN